MCDSALADNEIRLGICQMGSLSQELLSVSLLQRFLDPACLFAADLGSAGADRPEPVPRYFAQQTRHEQALVHFDCSVCNPDFILPS